jgi:hypothetical protein
MLRTRKSTASRRTDWFSRALNVQNREPRYVSTIATETEIAFAASGSTWYLPCRRAAPPRSITVPSPPTMPNLIISGSIVRTREYKPGAVRAMRGLPLSSWSHPHANGLAS